jgi:hypothetical protein
MSHMFSAPKMPTPTPAATPPPTPTDPVVIQQANALAREQAQAMGASSTLLTGAGGAPNPTVQRKTLLGS